MLPLDRRFQIGLLVLVIPVLYAVATATLFRYASVSWQVAPGGKRAATVRKTEYARHPNYTVEIWDTESGERVLRRSGPRVTRWISFSSTGDQFASLDNNGTIHLYDATRGQHRRTGASGSLEDAFTKTGIRGPVLNHFQFSESGDAIIYLQGDYSEEPPGTYLNAFDLRSGRVMERAKRLVIHANDRDARLEIADPQNHFFLVPTDEDLSRATVLRLRLHPAPSLGTISLPPKHSRISVSPTGESFAKPIFKRGVIAVHSLSTGEKLQEFAANTHPDGFSPDGRLLAWSSWERGVAIGDIETGRTVARFPGEGVNLAYGGFFAAPGHCFTLEDGNLVERGFDGSRRVAVYSPYRWWPLRQALSAAAFGVWLLAWLGTSIFYRRRSDALANVLVIHAAVLFPATLRLVSDSRAESSSLEAGLVQAAIGSLATLGVFWLIFGRARWPLRITIFLTGLAAFAIGLTLIWNSLHSHPLLVSTALKAMRQDFIVVAASGLGIALIGAAALAHFGLIRGFTITGQHPELTHRRSFTIPDMFRWAAGVAFICVVGRWIGVVSVDSDHMLALLRVGSIEGIAAVAAFWGMMGRGPAGLRLPVALLLIAGAAFLAHRLPALRELPSPAAVLLIRAAMLMLTLGVVRAIRRPAPTAGAQRDETALAPAV